MQTNTEVMPVFFQCNFIDYEEKQGSYNGMGLIFADDIRDEENPRVGAIGAAKLNIVVSAKVIEFKKTCMQTTGYHHTRNDEWFMYVPEKYEVETINTERISEYGDWKNVDDVLADPSYHLYHRCF